MNHTRPQVGVLPLPAMNGTPAPLDSQGEIREAEPIPSCDFGVEIGAEPSYGDLPRTAERKLSPKLCIQCRQHRALFRFRGRVRFRRDHDLCPRCWRSAMDRVGATQLLTVRNGRSGRHGDTIPVV